MGMPLQTAVEHNGVGCWGYGNELLVVALFPNQMRWGQGNLGPELTKPCSNGLV